LFWGRSKDQIPLREERETAEKRERERLLRDREKRGVTKYQIKPPESERERGEQREC
jgi:hypothetical protein